MGFKPNPRTWMTFGVVFAWYAHSCQTSEPQSSQQSFEVKDEINLEGTGAEAASAKQDTQREKKLALAHPQKPDAWYTRKLIMTYPQPAPSRILQCKETAESASLSAKNFKELDEAALSIGTKVQQSKPLYHWCFYQLMTDLDLKLERDASLLTEKSEIFLTRMRTLWVIAKALDDTGSSKAGNNAGIYNSYLRTRYMEISQHQFGRPVEVIDPDALLQTAGKLGKSAENYHDPE